MKNYVNGNEYSGRNEVLLLEAGYDYNDEFVTFKQAIKLDGISGKALAGLKKAATLVRFSKTETTVDESGDHVSKPIYYAVFDVNDVLARRAA